MPTSADLLLDTSAAIALVQRQHTHHAPVLAAIRDKTIGLAGHALVETYSVLTRLPGAQRLTPATAARLIRHNFPAPHAISARTALTAVDTLEAAGISGGAVYDGLVALAVREAGVPLLTCDRRALTTYTRLLIDVRVAPAA